MLAGGKNESKTCLLVLSGKRKDSDRTFRVFFLLFFLIKKVLIRSKKHCQTKLNRIFHKNSEFFFKNFEQK